MSATPGVPQATIDEFVGVAHGDFDRVKALLAEHPDLLNANATWNETALGAAAQMGREDIVTYLLAAGAPLDICSAAMLGDEARVRTLLAADPALARATGAHGIPALYYPVIRGHRAIAELLLAAGADPRGGAGGVTPLHGAALFDRPEMAEWLLASGADTSAKDHEGQTPLDVAEAKGHAATAAVLRRPA